MEGAGTCWMRDFAVNCKGNVTCFGFFAVQLFKACASAVGHRRRLNDGFRRWIQPVNATHSSNISAGVLNPSVFLGRWFNCLAIASKLSCE